MVSLLNFSPTPLTLSYHPQLHPLTLRCHSDAHCISLHNHATPVTGLNSDQCLISPDFVPMSQATTYLSFSPYAAFAGCIFIDDNGQPRLACSAPALCVTRLLYIVGLGQNEKTAFFSFSAQGKGVWTW